MSVEIPDASDESAAGIFRSDLANVTVVGPALDIASVRLIGFSQAASFISGGFEQTTVHHVVAPGRSADDVLMAVTDAPPPTTQVTSGDGVAYAVVDDELGTEGTIASFAAAGPDEVIVQMQMTIPREPGTAELPDHSEVLLAVADPLQTATTSSANQMPGRPSTRHRPTPSDRCS